MMTNRKQAQDEDMNVLPTPKRKIALMPRATRLAATPSAATVADGSERTKAKQLADLAMDPGVNAAAVAIEYLSTPGGELSAMGMIDSLRKSMDDLASGNLGRAESMLFAQAHSLQAIFVEMARRAVKHERMEHREASLRMALKAQSQCRMTLETLATIKNPPIVIARQANISHGPQQVNNAAAAQCTQGKITRAEKKGERAKRTIGGKA